jgi:serine/threonine protein kinase
MLCDFGLCSKFDPKLPLHEFCGSPGFFDPEMVSKSSYFGDKADIWSFGAVFLEMVLGHEAFCDIWMLAYDYDCVQDKEKFVSAIGHLLDTLPKDLESAEMPRAISDFLFCILQAESTDRSDVIELLRQPWFGCEVEISAAPTPPRNISSMTLLDLAISEQVGQSNSYDSSITRGVLLENSISQRERKQLELHLGSSFHLPPVELSTPTVSGARKMFKGSPRKAEEKPTSF